MNKIRSAEGESGGIFVVRFLFRLCVCIVLCWFFFVFARAKEKKKNLAQVRQRWEKKGGLRWSLRKCEEMQRKPLPSFLDEET
jgi:hypothetical protein